MTRYRLYRGKMREHPDGEWCRFGDVAQADVCHCCGSISGVYLSICDNCMTRLNRLEAEKGEKP